MSRSLIVIDDDPVIRSVLRKLLTHQGYRVKVADGAPEAVALAKEEQFDLIISDIRMPGRDGVETIRDIRNIVGLNQESPVIFITGYADEQAQKRALDLGYADYLLKPFDLKEFLHKVEQAIESPKEPATV